MGCERIRPKSVLMENSHSASTLKFHQPSPFKRRRGENKTKQKIPWVLQVFLDHQVLIFPLPGSGSYLPILFFTCYHILFARFTLKTIITPGPPFPERIRNNQELQKLHFTGKVKLLETLSFQENKSVSNSLWAAGRGWEGGESPPIGLTGLITQTKPVLTIGYQRGLLPGMLRATLSGSGPTSQDPFREDAGGKGHREGPRLLFSCNRMTGCWLDTRLTDGISKGFREPSGVGTIITNRASNKARRVTSWKKRSKTNSIILGRHIKIYQANKLQLSAA